MRESMCGVPVPFIIFVLQYQNAPKPLKIYMLISFAGNFRNLIWCIPNNFTSWTKNPLKMDVSVEQSMRALKKKRAGGLGTEPSTCMSGVLTLDAEALVPLRHKAANDCLVKFPGLRCEPGQQG